MILLWLSCILGCLTADRSHFSFFDCDEVFSSVFSERQRHLEKWKFPPVSYEPFVSSVKSHLDTRQRYSLYGWSAWRTGSSLGIAIPVARAMKYCGDFQDTLAETLGTESRRAGSTFLYATPAANRRKTRIRSSSSWFS